MYNIKENIQEPQDQGDITSDDLDSSTNMRSTKAHLSFQVPTRDLWRSYMQEMWE